MTIERAAVDRLYLEYISIIDDGDLGDWPELFTESCSYRIASRENAKRGLPLAVMRCDSRAMLRDRVHAIQSSAYYVSRVVRHLLGMLDVQPHDDGVAVKASYAVFASLPRSATTLLSAGVYDDVIVVDDGRLRFRQKHCIFDGDLVTDSIVYPL